MQSRIEWVLRIAVFGEFLGHGLLAIQGKASWIGWIQQVLSVDVSMATQLLLLIGVVDVLVAIVVLVWRSAPKVVLLYAVVWGFFTALVRPVVGESILDFIERFANWGAPLALLMMYGWPKNAQEWFRVK